MVALTVSDDVAHPIAGLSAQDRERMILKFAPLVRYVVGRLALIVPQVFDTEDLLSYGTIGLIEAVDRFDPSRGVSFESFAGERIRGSVIDALRAADWVPRTSRKRVKDIQRAFTELEERLGRVPTDDEVATELSITPSQMRKALADAMCTVVSLQRVVRTGDDDEGATLLDCLSDDAPAMSHGIEQYELRQSLVGALRRLDERERHVLSLYYERELTLREISEVLEISESRVWQLHARAITRLRAYIDADSCGEKGAA